MFVVAFLFTSLYLFYTGVLLVYFCLLVYHVKKFIVFVFVAFVYNLDSMKSNNVYIFVTIYYCGHSKVLVGWLCTLYLSYLEHLGSITDGDLKTIWRYHKKSILVLGSRRCMGFRIRKYVKHFDDSLYFYMQFFITDLDWLWSFYRYYNP